MTILTRLASLFVRRCCLDITPCSWISLISICDVSITESLCPLLSFFFFFFFFFPPPFQSISMLSLPFTCLSGLCDCFCFARAYSLQSRFSKSQASLPEFCPCFCVWPFLWREFRHDLSHRLVFQMVIVLLHGAGCSLQLLFSLSFLFFLFFCRKIYAWVRNPTLSPLISLWQRQFLITKAKWTPHFMPVKHVGQYLNFCLWKCQWRATLHSI